jgi:hypothetical protein
MAPRAQDKINLTDSPNWDQSVRIVMRFERFLRSRHKRV